MQRFAGSLDAKGATKGIFVTTSTYSQGARDFVNHITKRIVLIDGAEFARLMAQHNIGVLTCAEPNELKKIDENYFTE